MEPQIGIGEGGIDLLLISLTFVVSMEPQIGIRGRGTGSKCLRCLGLRGVCERWRFRVGALHLMGGRYFGTSLAVKDFEPESGPT